MNITMNKQIAVVTTGFLVICFKHKDSITFASWMVVEQLLWCPAVSDSSTTCRGDGLS